MDLSPFTDPLTPADLREILRVSENTVYAELASGRIPSFRVGKQYRTTKRALLGYIEAQGFPCLP